MKNLLKLTVLVLFLSVSSAQLSTLHAQGALTPPGAPAPTMKSLAQIEPRTPISSLPFTIGAPGSYYVTTNLTGIANANGITITSGNVTLDLGGFAMTGVAGATNGILVSGSITNITVRNGILIGWPNNCLYVNSSPRNVVLERLNASGSVSAAFVVYNAQITDCSVMGGSYGVVSYSSSIRDCSVTGSGFGILINSCLVSGCFVQNCLNSGIYVSSPGNRIIGNTCIGNNTSATANQAGIYINHSGTLVENNAVFGSGHGGIELSPSYLGNIVIKNIVSGNGANNYLYPAGNDIGPIGTAATATSPWANISRN